MDDKVSVWKANLQNGIILGMTGVVYSLLMYFLDLTFNKPLGYAFFVVLIVLLYFLIKSYRDNYLHGYITYGASLGAGVIIFLYFSVISAIFTYILYKYIDPDLVKKQLAMTEELMIRRNTSQQIIDASIAMQKKLMIPEFIAPMSIITNMFFGTVLSLLVSIFTRKEGNPLVDAPTN
ncbi:MAG TPA: DUF4199 domain-containing protein [Bacteroidales bacterium]|nr:DUF4199 domain-containing protein [Bacteroidales bacterium]